VAAAAVVAAVVVVAAAVVAAAAVVVATGAVVAVGSPQAAKTRANKTILRIRQLSLLIVVLLSLSCTIVVVESG
jgi:hypothetical protein